VGAFDFRSLLFQLSESPHQAKVRLFFIERMRSLSPMELSDLHSGCIICSMPPVLYTQFGMASTMLSTLNRVIDSINGKIILFGREEISTPNKLKWVI
jgi:hypothetical protein